MRKFRRSMQGLLFSCHGIGRNLPDQREGVSHHHGYPAPAPAAFAVGAANGNWRRIIVSPHIDAVHTARTRAVRIFGGWPREFPCHACSIPPPPRYRLVGNQIAGLSLLWSAAVCKGPRANGYTWPWQPDGSTHFRFVSLDE